MGTTNKFDMMERAKMVLAMEYIARQVNDEEVMEEWLMYGVADGDVSYGDLSRIETVWDYIEDDESFAELMGTFLSVMSGAKKSGGLYCGNAVSK